jgi:hypothetical protein
VVFLQKFADGQDLDAANRPPLQSPHQEHKRRQRQHNVPDYRHRPHAAHTANHDHNDSDQTTIAGKCCTTGHPF